MKSRGFGTMLGTTLVLGMVFGLFSTEVCGAPSPRATVEPDLESGLAEGIVVKVDGPEADAQTTRGWIEERAAQVLDKEGVAPLEEGAVIRITVHGIAYDYRISLTLLRAGRAVVEEKQPAEIVCECGSDEMLDRVGAAIEDGVRVLAEVAAEERAAMAKAEVEAEAARQEKEKKEEAERKQEEERLAREEAPYRPSPLGFSGIGLGALGVGVLAGGIPLVFRSDAVRVNEAVVEERSTRPAGIVLTVAGSVVLAVGVTLLTLDIVEHRKRKLAIVPVVGRGFAGASVGMRF